MSEEFSNEARDLMNRLDETLPPVSGNADRAASADPAAGGDPLVRTAQRLAQAPDLRLTDAAQDRIEARLRARMIEFSHNGRGGHDAMDDGSASIRPLPRAVRRPLRRVTVALRWAAVLALVFGFALTGVTRAAASSLPGDTLYPVKRTVENVRLALSATDDEPRLRVQLAENRVDEFDALLADGEVYPRALTESVSELDHTLALLEAGYGSRIPLEPRIMGLLVWQEHSVNRALVLADASQQQELFHVAGQVQVLGARLMALDTDAPPDTDLLDASATPGSTETPTATATVTLTPTATPSPTMTATPTMTASPTGTGTPAASGTPSLADDSAESEMDGETMTPTATLTPSSTPPPSATATRVPPTATRVPPTAPPPTQPPPEPPTRTPPGHGDDPGLGDQPPGQGGDNPGVGNDGNPPGQDSQSNDDVNQSADQTTGQGSDKVPPGQDKDKDKKDKKN